MQTEKGNGGSRVGEMVGGTAAVCCCCPCVVMHLLIMAFKLPSGIWKKKRKLQRRRLLKKKTNKYSFSSSITDRYPQPIDDTGIMLEMTTTTNTAAGTDEDESSESGLGGSDMEIWDQFYRGFWRSPSLDED